MIIDIHTPTGKDTLSSLHLSWSVTQQGTLVVRDRNGGVVETYPKGDWTHVERVM